MLLLWLLYIGWAMQFALYMFVNRKWQDDEGELRAKLQLYNALDLPVQVLLFPGGGDLTLKSKSRSDEYADKKGLPHYNYVLQPHLRGFLYTLHILRSHKLEAIVDITVAYPDALPKTEVEFFKGRVPYEVCYYVRRYSLNSLPTSDEQLSEWLRQLWTDKEERLKYFYSNRKFPDKEQHTERRRSISKIYQAVLFFILTNVIVVLGLYHFSTITTIYLITAISWLLYKVVSNRGAIDQLLLHEIYSNKHVIDAAFDYQIPEHLIN